MLLARHRTRCIEQRGHTFLALLGWTVQNAFIAYMCRLLESFVLWLHWHTRRRDDYVSPF
jgi:hypothetical protein